jgi:peptidoglycan/LPS O-acetylase OafA/YrhL
MALFASSYDQLLGKNLGYYTTRFLLSIPFMYLGICISKINFAQVNKALLLALIVLGIGLQIAEAQFFASVFNFDKSMHEFLIGTIFIVIPLFILCLTINIPENKLTNWGKEYSLFIYLYHPVIYLILHAFFVKIFPRYSDNILVYNPFIGFIVILLLAITLKKHLNKTYKLLIGLIN